MFCPDIISLYFGDPWWLGSKFSQLLLYLPRFGLTVALEATIFTCFIRIAQRLFDPFKHRLNTLERQISDPEKTTWDPLHKHQTKHKKKLHIAHQPGPGFWSAFAGHRELLRLKPKDTWRGALLWGRIGRGSEKGWDTQGVLPQLWPS